jgi:CubicO group peptidase (beta-lactamase class C family)
MGAVIGRHVDDGSVVGGVALVSRGTDVHVTTAGHQRLGGATPMQRDSIFRIASLTKPVTAVAALMLVEECVLRLDDPVDDLLPELANRRVLTRLDAALDDTVAAHRPIVVRDLLAFTAGTGVVMAMPGTYPIQRAMDERDLGQGPPRPRTLPDPNEWMRRFGELPLMHQPGEQWMYNTGSDVLGVLVARAAGRPLDVFVRERIFEPLGMRDTAFSVPADGADRLVTAYQRDPATGALSIYDEAVGGEWASAPAFPAGAAGLVSTVDDYFAFARMLLDRGVAGTSRLLARPTVEAMTEDQLTPDQKAASQFVPGFFGHTSWGFGVAVVTRRLDLATPGQYGWDGGLGTSWRNDPREGLIGIVFTQTAFDSPVPPAVVRDFWTLAAQSVDD